MVDYLVMSKSKHVNMHRNAQTFLPCSCFLQNGIQYKMDHHLWQSYWSLGSSHKSHHSSLFINTVEIAIWVKTLEGHPSIMMDLWSMHSLLKELGPCFRPYPELCCKIERLLQGREQRLNYCPHQPLTHPTILFTYCHTQCLVTGKKLPMKKQKKNCPLNYHPGSSQLVQNQKTTGMTSLCLI